MVKTPILVFCRIKPNSIENKNEIQDYSITKEQDKENLILYNLQSNNIVSNHKPEYYNFQFIKVFEHTTSQNMMYEIVAQPVVQRVLEGYNGTIFAYGQTGSGKTYTISGDQDNPGIVPRALEDIFNVIGQAEEKYDIKMSYLEIYNEHSNDLLIPVTNEKKKILLRESSDKIMQWHNLSLIPIRSYSEAIDLIAIGDNNRIVGDTPMNIFSSRSHTILTIYLSRLQDDFEVLKAKLNLVDLAGSERVHKTGEEGIVLEEARHINLSLHYLEQVIVALSDSARTHVPYRNCTMTSALRDSLGGNCFTAMIANIAVDKSNVEETVSTCRFAQRVALVKNYLSVNTERDLVAENSLLREEIQQLKKECTSLKIQVRELNKGKLQEKQQSQFPLSNHMEESQRTEEEMCISKSKPVLPNLSQPHLNESVLPPSLQPGGLNTQQLQTDIIHLISWLQDELNTKKCHLGKCDFTLRSSSFLSTDSIEPDERFDDFMSTIEVKDHWLKLKEKELRAAEDLSVKTNAINSIHQNILSWWRRHEKSLVQEVLASRPLKLGTAAEFTTPSPSSPKCNINLDSLLIQHSDLLTDFQLLKSKLKNSKRNLQRIQRKYSIEFNEWKKNERVHSGQNCKEMSGVYNSDLFSLKLSGSATKHSSEDNFKDYSKNQSGYSTQRISKENFKFNLIDKCCNSDTLISLSECDLNTTLGDLNDSAFSTSTRISNNSLGTSVACEWPTLQLRQVRSMPSDLHTQAPKTHHWLTGDQEVDNMIIEFYENKCLN